ncbi:MAG: Ig-like domain-containing protein [Acidobacteriota bacterium]
MSTIRKAAFNPASLSVILVATLFLASSYIRPAAEAAGTLISAPDRVDMVYDDQRRILYITSQGSVLRYSLDTDSFLSPYTPGGDLAGIDISPDGKMLAVADRTRTATDVWIHLIDLETDAVTQALFARADGEGGTFSVAFGSDGNLLITSIFEGSGTVPLRKYNPQTGESTKIADIEMKSMVTSSGDWNVIALAEANNPDGPFGRYQVGGQLLRKIGSDGTRRFNYEIGANRDASQYAVITVDTSYIVDSDLVKQNNIGESPSSRPVGVVYHPAEGIVYFAWAGTTEVRALNTNTFSVLAVHNFQNNFGAPSSAFQEGRLKISGDGSILFATVAGGVRYVRNYAPLTAGDQMVVVAKNGYKIITLSGSVGNNGQLKYRVLTDPQHGSLSGEVPELTYTSAPDYTGPDSFTFEVSYGRATAKATVTLDVTDINAPPQAIGRNITIDEDAAIFVLLDGRDPENDPMTYHIITQPAHGQVSGNGPTIIYAPEPNYSGQDKFEFRVSDGLNESNKATIAITIKPVNDPPVADPQTLTLDEDTAKQIDPKGSDVDRDPLTFAIASNPQHGTLTNSLSGWVYTPDPNYSGEDSFTFKANDRKADSLPATIMLVVNPVNDKPVAVNDSASTKKKKTVTINALANDSDIDGDTLAITSTTQGARGKVEVVGSQIKYKPKTKFNGTDTFTYTITDGRGGTATATVTVTVKK